MKFIKKTVGFICIMFIGFSIGVLYQQPAYPHLQHKTQYDYAYEQLEQQFNDEVNACWKQYEHLIKMQR